MKPKAFDYIRVATAREAVEQLARGGEEARLLAGGQSLVPMMNFRLVDPGLLIDVSRVEELSYIRLDGSMIEVGGSTTQIELERWPDLASKSPLLSKAIPYIGHFQTRSRGTVCGSLSHADPSSELPLCLATMGGEVVLQSIRGKRTLSAGDFQTGMLSTAREADEYVVAARYPVNRPGEGYAFTEVAQRRGDFAIVALAAVAGAKSIRLGVGGVADKPAVRDWGDLTGGDLDEALNAFAWDLGGYDDTHASAQYRRQLVRRLGRRVIEEAKSCRS